MSASELLVQILGRGDGGADADADADADWEWEIAREMNHSWGPRCCLRDEERADNDETVPVAWTGLAEGAGGAIDGIDGYDDDGHSRVGRDVRWRAAALLL